MELFLKLIHIFVSVFLILVVLLQAGRGGGMGAAFGGASAQIFGGRGASNFLSRVTSSLAVIFFLTSLSLSMMSSQHQSVMRDRPIQAAPTDTDAPDPMATPRNDDADTEEPASSAPGTAAHAP